MARRFWSLLVILIQLEQRESLALVHRDIQALNESQPETTSLLQYYLYTQEDAGDDEDEDLDIPAIGQGM